MKNLILPLLLLAFHVNAQQATGTLENQTIRCHVTSTGDLFYPEADEDLPGFEAPANSGLRAIYAANFWIGGLSSNGDIHIAAEQGQPNVSDWFCGPLTIDGAATASETIQDMYNRVWSGNRADVITHQNQFADGSPDVGYVAPEWMFDWPTHGNVFDGLDYYQAPFFDFNGDNVYNPGDGDYPIFCGDRCLLWFFNDNGGPHTASQGSAIGVQVLATAYVFDDPAYSNAVYFNYRVTNMGALTINDTYVGWFTDFDLGNSNDDYMESWVSQNAIYAYNGDDFDEPTSMSNGYGDDLAMAAFVLLNGPRQNADGIDNPLGPPILETLDMAGQIYPNGRNGYGDGIIDNEHLGLSSAIFGSSPGAINEQSNPLHLYNRLLGLWSDGSPMTYGENGQNPTNITATCMYPTNTDPGGLGTGGVGAPDWTEITAGNQPGDRRAHASSGPFTFSPGQILNLDFAYVFVRDSETFDDLQLQLYYELENTHEHFREHLSPCAQDGQTVGLVNIESKDTDIFPNPAGESFMVQSPSFEQCAVKLYDTTGQLVLDTLTPAYAPIAIEHLAPGMYHVIIDVNGQSTYKKLLITQP
ncbi:MAG: hypothetical protein RLZZ262_663 [Bacteroidota bacterium]